MMPILLVCFAAGLAALSADFAKIAADTPGRVGAAAMILETGERVAVRGNERFPMQSVYKFPIAMAVLHEVDSGAFKLDQSVRIERRELVPPALHSPVRDRYPDGASLPLREILRYAVSESDGTASDVLLRLAGGPAKVTAYLEGLGIRGVRVVTSEMEMSRGEQVQYRNWAQPEAMIDLLRAFHEGRGLTPASRGMLLQWMTVTTTGLKRLKGSLPETAEVAHKTGTSGTDHGLTRATNDVGIITLPNGRHLAIAVFVSDSPANLETREGAIAKIGRAAWDAAVSQK